MRPALAALLALMAGTAAAENWPAWRGPRGDGVSSEPDVPLHWSEKQHLAWKTRLPEWGDSTPAVWDDAIFVTSQQDDNNLLLRIDRHSGAIQWTVTVGSGTASRAPVVAKKGDERRSQKFHGIHNLASPSPVTDGHVVACHFGNGDVAVCDFAGHLLWKRNLQDDYGPYTIWWGHANSPVLWRNLLISVCMQDSLSDLGGPVSPSYVVAHDLRTGEVAWKTMRMTGAIDEACDSYTTPLLVPRGDETELILMGGRQLDAYDPATGRQRWVLPNLQGSRNVSGPTVAHGVIYATQGMRGAILAVKPGAAGELAADAVLWRFDQGTPDACTPVVAQDRLFCITDDGIAKCLDARSGELQWKQRLPGEYRASPIAAAGRIYFLNTAGLCTVVEASPRYQVLASNELEDMTVASPVVSGGRLLVRGKQHLYCIVEPRP